MRRTAITVMSAGLLAAALAGCSSSGSSVNSANSDNASGSTKTVTGAITVFAAASLTDTFTTLGKQFEAANPGTTITFSFAGSSALATQIVSGAPADVFASASGKKMAQVVTAGDAASPTNFAKNIMEIAVPPSNPAAVASLADLAKTSVKVALCQPQVPCGETAETVFVNAKITVAPVTLEPDVKSVLSKVELNEVDAGVVYVTDVRAAGAKVKGVTIPADRNASTEYPIAVLSKSANNATAQAFVAYVLSPAGQSVLAAAGFGQP
jgi:molybdate transport system substrate-binding protein